MIKAATPQGISENYFVSNLGEMIGNSLDSIKNELKYMDNPNST